jgi:hypothetical protein
MFIKNQTFKDEETLMEMLFDFGLGTPSELTGKLVAEIDKELEENEAYIQYRDSLQDADDRSELYEEERDMRLAEKLLEAYEAFEVKDSKLYATKGGNKALLYEIDLY